MEEPTPHNCLLLTLGLLQVWQCATVQASYIFNNVGLSISPSSSVESGTNVTLQCEVSISQDSASELLFHFQFTKNDEVIAYSDSREESAQYQLFPARAADSGSYGCHVTVKEKSRSSLEKTFTVTGLQKPVLTLNKTSVFESEEVLARCSADSEKGSLVFFFYQRFRSGDTQEVKRSMSRGNSLETKLTLRHIGDSLLYCDYEVPLVGRSNHSNQVQVIVKGMFISPIMNVIPSSEVYEGDQIEVVCKVVGEHRDVEVFLIKDKKILSQARVSLTYQLRAREGDSGELVCKAQWGTLQKETYQKIIVKELISKPRLEVEPEDLFEGDHLKMTCLVSVYVPDRIQNNSLKYSIYKGRKEVTNVNVYNTWALASKNGNYTCKVQASSASSSLVKESKTLVVSAKVPVSKPSLSVVGGTLVLGKPFQLLCQSDRGSLPITYTLHVPKKTFPEFKVITSPGETAIFNTSVTKISDLNNFLCQAKNHKKIPPEVATGQQLQESTTIIEPVSRPVLTSAPAVDDITERHDVTLFCSVLRGTPPVTFTWYSAESRSALGPSQTTHKLKGSYIINDVGPQHNGGYYCVCTNPANDTRRSETMTIAVKMAGWKKALIAIVCLLLLVSVILVVAFKKHLIGFKRKRTAELSVKSAGTKIERLSLTQSEVTNMANATPSMMGKSVWSEHVSGSESENENGVAAPKTPELQYAEVQTKQADESRPPVKKGTDTTYSEVRHSRQGVPEPADSTSVEYAELNHDAEPPCVPGNHDDHAVPEEPKEETCPEKCATTTDTAAGEHTHI